MKLRTFWIIIVVLLLFMFINNIIDRQKDKKFRENINRLEKQRDSLKIIDTKSIYKIDSLQKIITLKESKIDTLNLRIEHLKNKRNEIPDIVIDMDERQLDSILTNYRAPKRN